MNVRAAWAALWAECDWRVAIRCVNQSLETGEGVDLLYYQFFGEHADKSMALIKRVIR